MKKNHLFQFNFKVLMYLGPQWSPKYRDVFRFSLDDALFS